MTQVVVNVGYQNSALHNHIAELRHLLCDKPYLYLQPTAQHQQAALSAAKAILDRLARDVANAQTSRRNENGRKRKRGSDETEDTVLRLRQIHTAGFGVKQVWEQARRVLDVACTEIERGIDSCRETENELQIPSSPDESHFEEPNGLSDEDDPGEPEIDDGDDDMLDGESEDDGLEEEEDIEASSDSGSATSEADEVVPEETYHQDPNNLNDGFFSIDDFNKESQFLEQMDARGEEDNRSDEDHIDWDADPLAEPLSLVQTGRKSGAIHMDQNNASDEEGKNGATFGSTHLNADNDGSDADADDIVRGELDGMMPGLANTNEIRYADFFEPPPTKPSKTKRTRPLPKTQPAKAAIKEVTIREVEDDRDLERAMVDVQRDLFDSDEEMNEDEDLGASEDDDSDALPRPSKSRLADKNLSSHEKQRLQIADEIRRLEALNIAKKPWTLSGEASAGARPINSLIEEDLEFERTGKPVPVITADVSNEIEVLIKRRITARDFDEVVRRTPATSDAAAEARRGRADTLVDDAKPATSLGEIYEAEYQRRADPTTYIDNGSAATKKQHQEIDRLWKEVRDQLDVLGNLHFKPKRAEIEIKTVEDKPRIAMEDARPSVSGAGIDDGATTLAPQEVYKPGTDTRAANGEVINQKSGVSRSREEMTREEKVRKRRREKERKKKGRHRQPPQSPSQSQPSTKAEQETILKDLKQGDVQIIGKGASCRILALQRRTENVIDIHRVGARTSCSRIQRLVLLGDTFVKPACLQEHAESIDQVPKISLCDRIRRWRKHGRLSY